MKRMISYPKIGDFNSVIRDITFMSQYTGVQGEDGNPIMNRAAVQPILPVHATEKIHGTNASVCFSNLDDLWVQSRENIITLEKDNAGCATRVMAIKSVWLTIIGALAAEHKINLDTHIISIYFEWSGGNIQKASAVSGLDKRAILFKYFKVSPLEPQEDNKHDVAFWLPTCVTGTLSFDEDNTPIWLDYPSENIYNVMNYPNWEFLVDFNFPKLSQNKFLDLVLEKIEPSSPLGTEMGIENNVGEGIVCEFWYKDTLHRFKVKGDKHSTSRVKTLKPVDDVKEMAKINFATEVVTAGRCEQGWQKIFGIDNELAQPDKVQMGPFLKWIMNDVVAEETQRLLDSGLTFSETTKYVSKIAKEWFENQLNEFYQNR